MKKILFALTSHDRKGDTGQPTGFYVPEAAHPWAILRDVGYEIEFVSPKGGKPPMDGADATDSISREFMTSPDVMRKLEKTATPANVRSEDYAAILYVGGHGTMWDFPGDHVLATVGAAIYDAGGVVGAVCHGPAGLVNLRLSDGRYLVSGKRVAAFTDDEERAVKLDTVVPFLLATKLQERGAIHVAKSNWQDNVVVDERLVTGQNPASAEGVGRQMAQILASR